MMKPDNENDTSFLESAFIQQNKLISAFITLVYEDGSMSQHVATALDENGMTIELKNAKSKG